MNAEPNERNGDDYRKITGAVEDAVTYPILTRDVTSTPGESTSVTGPTGGASLDSVAQGTLRQLLGWRYRADDTKGFLAALTKTIQLKEVRGHIEWDVQPQSYMVQADLGEVTGAQASIYARAQVALNQTLPLLNGLTLLGVPVADPEDMEATRAIIQTEFTALVNELGVVGGPRVQRVDSFFSQLLGPSPPPIPVPKNANGQLGILGCRFGLKRSNVNTVDDELDYTNYLMLYDYIYSLYQTWKDQRAYFTGRGHAEPYLGTQLVLISQALDALEESVQEAYDAMDSVFFGASDRQATELHLHGQPLITVADLFSWVEEFANSEGLQLVQEGGKDGVVAFRSIINQLEYLMFLAMKESRAHSSNPVHGFHTSRVQRALQNVSKFLDLTEQEAKKIHRGSPVFSIKHIALKSDTLTIEAEHLVDGEHAGHGESPGAQPSVSLIDDEDPARGFDACNVKVGPVDRQSKKHGWEMERESVEITATFPHAPSDGRYIVVVKNPDGEYAWREYDANKSTGALQVRPSPVHSPPPSLPLQQTVPPIVALDQNDAIAAINSAHLRIGTLTQVHSATVAGGKVISQSPAAGALVADGAPVDLVISLGPLQIPEMTGMTEGDAVNKIKSVNLTAGMVNRRPSAIVPAGKVISHSPPGGTAVQEGSPVSLVISSGRRRPANIR